MLPNTADDEHFRNAKDQVWILNVDVDVSNLTKTKTWKLAPKLIRLSRINYGRNRRISFTFKWCFSPCDNNVCVCVCTDKNNDDLPEKVVHTLFAMPSTSGVSWKFWNCEIYQTKRGYEPCDPTAGWENGMKNPTETKSCIHWSKALVLWRRYADVLHPFCVN